MGEVVVSSEDRMEVVVMEERENGEMRKIKEVGGGGSSSMVRWERFLSSVAVRVLLVESDDSTRQIIAALLRKCSYKVAAVPDGLKAWEVLKARPHNIDLILTEVELPSISGYALLTLIMEHEICKNIPVIMMSTHDSVSTVYKCMLRGAADFLVKPVRTNELKNLWQHVWRRQSMRNEGLSPQEESVGQQKLEATAENNATSGHSTSSKTSSPRKEECMKKGSDAQSSCGKPDLEAESGYMAEVEDHMLPKQMKSPVSDMKIQEHSNHANSRKNVCSPESAVAGSLTAAGNDHGTVVKDGRLELQRCEENVNRFTEVSSNRNALVNSTREAIDLIGVLGNHSRQNSCGNDGGNRFESSQELNLSLRRFHSDNLENKTTQEKQTLNHSNASAFTRYVNRPPYISNATATATATSGSIPRGDKLNDGDNLSDSAPGCNTAKDSTLPYDRKVISLPVDLTKEVEEEYQNASQKLFPTLFPARGVRVDVRATPSGYGSSNHPLACTPSPSPNPSSTNQQMNSFPQFNVAVVNGRHHFHPFDQSPRVSSNQPVSKQDPNLESLEARSQFSPATEQSASSNLCNGNAGHLNGFGCATIGGSIGNVHQDAVVPGGSESGNEQSHVNHDMSRQRSIQREAALTKFRLKRKERCYEKKVRYESRKKLAEQRPRVKGQFVRQVPPDPPPKSDGYSVGS